jgi:hypothetical protein
MCVNCGCGEYDERHKPTDMTMDDLRKMAEGQNMDVKQTAENILQATQGALGDRRAS